MYAIRSYYVNFEIRKGGKIQAIDKSQSIPERMKENLAARGIKDLNEGREKPYYRTIVNIILGGSRDRMREIAFGDQQVDYNIGADNSDVVRTKNIEQWAKDMYNFVARITSYNVCYTKLLRLYHYHYHRTIANILMSCQGLHPYWVQVWQF